MHLAHRRRPPCVRRTCWASSVKPGGDRARRRLRNGRCFAALICKWPMRQVEESMDIVETLKQQHQEVRSLLEKLISEEDRKERRSILTQVGKALRLHMVVEEKMVYPADAKAFQGEEDETEQ